MISRALRIAAIIGLAHAVYMTAVSADALAEDIGNYRVGSALDQEIGEGLGISMEWKSGAGYQGYAPPDVLLFEMGADRYATSSTIGLEFSFDNRFAVMPFTGATRFGSSRGQDEVIEFQTGLELSYRFENDTQLGLSGLHFSGEPNDEDTAGSGLLMLRYSAPTDWFTR